MTLDPDPQTYCPNVVDNNSNSVANEEQDKSLTCFTKYIFWNEPNEKCDDKDANEDEDDEVSLEDATINELNRALRVKEVEAEKHIKKVLMQRKLMDETFPRVLFLGTSAAGSFPLRNSSGILVHLS